MTDEDKSKPRCCYQILSDVASPDGTRCWCSECKAEWVRVKGRGWKMIEKEDNRAD